MKHAATAEARSSLRGIVETVFYSGPAFTAGRLRTTDGALVNFAGKVFAKPNEAVRLEGQWADHPKYGRQFAVECLGYDLEVDADGSRRSCFTSMCRRSTPGTGPAFIQAIRSSRLRTTTNWAS